MRNERIWSHREHAHAIFVNVDSGQTFISSWSSERRAFRSARSMRRLAPLDRSRSVPDTALASATDRRKDSPRGCGAPCARAPNTPRVVMDQPVKPIEAGAPTIGLQVSPWGAAGARRAVRRIAQPHRQRINRTATGPGSRRARRSTAVRSSSLARAYSASTGVASACELLGGYP